MRSRSVSLSVLIFTVLSVAISFIKFNRCADSGWISPGVYHLNCYTDITALYEIRGFAKDLWPYGLGSDSLEYPILSGIGIWLIALITKNGPLGLHQFFYLNLVVISVFFGYLLYLLAKIDRKSALLLTISPAVISALFINWDIWALTPFVASLYFLHIQRHQLSGIALSCSIFFKFFPIIFLIPMVISIWRLPKARTSFIQGFLVSALTFNLPFVLADPSGWAKFYIFNYQRGVDFGSIWYLISLKGTWISALNQIATPLVLTILLILYFRYQHQLIGCIYLASVIFFTLNKVYSPQYVLWLTVISLLFFPKTKLFLLLFACWQVAEVAYQSAIWSHILGTLNEPDAISINGYFLVTSVRIGALLLMAGYALYLLENDFVKSSSRKTNVQTDIFAHLRSGVTLQEK